MFSDDYLGRLFSDEKEYKKYGQIWSSNNINITDELYKAVLDKLNNTIKRTHLADSLHDYIYKNKQYSESDYSAYTALYTIIDILGYNRDKKFINMINDSIHYAYSTYCDYYVTQDKASKFKSKFCNKFFNIENKIMNIYEFSIELKYLINKIESQKFISDPLIDALGSKVSYNTITSDFATTNLYLLDYYYLGHFNRIQYIDNDKFHSFCLFKNSKNKSYNIFLKEYPVMIEIISNMVGRNYILEYESGITVDSMDINQAKSDEVKSVHWIVDSNSMITLTMNYEAPNIIFLTITIRK